MTRRRYCSCDLYGIRATKWGTCTVSCCIGMIDDPLWEMYSCSSKKTRPHSGSPLFADLPPWCAGD